MLRATVVRTRSPLILDSSTQDGRDITGEYDPSAHGYGGPVGISVANYQYATQTAITGAAGQVAGFSANQDANGGNMLGVSWASLNQGVSIRL